MLLGLKVQRGLLVENIITSKKLVFIHAFVVIKIFFYLIQNLIPDADGQAILRLLMKR